MNASPIMAIILLRANRIPICEYPSKRNGKLIATIRMDNDTWVVSDISREIPIAPPSINKLGSKNPLSPKPAETIPIRIKIVSWPYEQY